MTKIINWDQVAPEDIISDLRLRSMKRHYADFVSTHGPVEADIKMARLYSTKIWEAEKDEIYRWFENDFYRDSDGNVHV